MLAYSSDLRPSSAQGCSTWGVAAACSDPAYVYVAARYDEVNDCLAETAALDVVRGKYTENPCDPVCLVRKDGQGVLGSTPADGGGPVVFVSTVCPPYPPEFDTSGTTPACTPALAASKAGKVMGAYCHSAERAVALAKRGVRFLAVGSDMAFLRAGAAAALKVLRG